MSTLMSLLSVQGERRSRSKSPSGRERERSRSNVREEKPDPRRESDRRKSSRRHSDSDSDRAPMDDRRRYETRSTRKHYDSDEKDDPRKSRGSNKYGSPDKEVDEYRTRRTPRDDEQYGSSSKKSLRRRSDSDSDDGHVSRYETVKPKIITATPTSAATPAKVPLQSAVKSTMQVQSPRGQVNAYSYAPSPGHVPQPPGAFPDLPHGALSETRHMSYAGNDPRYTVPQPPYASRPDDYRQRTVSNAGQQYAQVPQFQYAQVAPRVAYKDPNASVPASAYEQHSKPIIATVDPRRSDSKILDKKYVEDRYSPREKERERRYSEDKYKPRDKDADRKERKLDDRLVTEEDNHSARRLSRLSIGGAAGAATLGVAAAGYGHGSSNGDAKPPPSPLLEAYSGTYQSISPMPSALVLAGHKFDSDVSDVDLDSDSGFSDDDPETKRKRTIKRLEKEKQWIEKKQDKGDDDPVEYERKRPTKQQYETRTPDDDFSLVSSAVSPRVARKQVSWYDAESDAKEMAAALKGSKPPNIKPLLRILPFLSIDDLDALKAEYKNHATIQGQGINMSKHIKARVTGHFGKAAYACSLGQYESDAYWANCFYQSGASRRELLIESLLGRTNQQIREIKNFFKDKKYDDDLEKCLKAELKADKFRAAILLALEERRQAESPVLDPRTVRHDVQDLYEALNSPGGESAMMRIILVRSDTHLREILRQYERAYGQNFAREMINKSRNLVGESLAHVLNGALNRSMRDALLLHQAIAETAPGKERAELLISRLIRLHWEPKHLEKVKTQYAQRYGMKVDDAIKKDIQSQMKTEEGLAWTNFCIALIRSSEQ